MEHVIERIRKNMGTIRKFGVRKIGLFGSFARGEQRKGSDIDILVEFEKGKKTFDNYMDLKFYLERILGREVDLVIKDALKPRIRKRIYEELRPVL